MKDNDLCVWYKSSTNFEGVLENPINCGDCKGYKTGCDAYVPSKLKTMMENEIKAKQTLA